MSIISQRQHDKKGRILRKQNVVFSRSDQINLVLVSVVGQPNKEGGRNWIHRPFVLLCFCISSLSSFVHLYFNHEWLTQLPTCFVSIPSKYVYLVEEEVPIDVKCLRYLVLFFTIKLSSQITVQQITTASMWGVFWGSQVGFVQVPRLTVGWIMP